MDFSGVNPDPVSDVTIEVAVFQAMQRHPEAVTAFACGDRAAFDTLKKAALRAAGGEFEEAEIAEALARRLREGL